MQNIEAVFNCMQKSEIPLFSACRFNYDLVLPNVRSASRLPKEAKTVIIGLFPYYTGQHEERNLSLYSIIPDYHVIAGDMLKNACECLKELFPENSFEFFVDASPIDEVTAALRAGLGVKGQNGQLITKQYGSFVFVGEIVSDLELGTVDCDIKMCEGCGACLTTCPTGALRQNRFDKAICRSHFSQKKGELSDWEKEQLKSGGLAWGCDICTLVCPHNKYPEITPIKRFLNDVQPNLNYENIDALMRNRAFAWRGEKVLRRNLSIIE